MSKTDVVTHIESRAKEARKAASKLAAVNKRTDEQEGSAAPTGDI